ncbi:hypothetical protein STEG23_008327, partial [Scotinomys teguina]
MRQWNKYGKTFEALQSNGREGVVCPATREGLPKAASFCIQEESIIHAACGSMGTLRVKALCRHGHAGHL